MKANSLLSVIRNSVIGYFGNLYLTGEKNEVDKGVFTYFSRFFGCQESLSLFGSRHPHRVAFALSSAISVVGWPRLTIACIL